MTLLLQLDKDLGEPTLSIECNLSGNDFTCPLPVSVISKRCLEPAECSRRNEL